MLDRVGQPDCVAVGETRQTASVCPSPFGDQGDFMIRNVARHSRPETDRDLIRVSPGSSDYCSFTYS